MLAKATILIVIHNVCQFHNIILNHYFNRVSYSPDILRHRQNIVVRIYGYEIVGYNNYLQEYTDTIYNELQVRLPYTPNVYIVPIQDLPFFMSGKLDLDDYRFQLCS